MSGLLACRTRVQHRETRAVPSPGPRDPHSGGAGRPSDPRGPCRPERRETHAATGVVKWFNAEKGFGFIAIKSGGKDVFVHASVVASSGLTSLSEDQKVTVKFVAGKKGPEARFIRPKD